MYMLQVISVCNQTVRSPDLSLDDEYTVDSLNKFAEFLQSVLTGMTVKCDITSCQDAVADIEKVCYCHYCCCLVNFIYGDPETIAALLFLE